MCFSMVINSNSFLQNTLIFPNSLLRNKMLHSMTCATGRQSWQTGSITRVHRRRSRVLFLGQSGRLYGEVKVENILSSQKESVQQAKCEHLFQEPDHSCSEDLDKLSLLYISDLNVNEGDKMQQQRGKRVWVFEAKLRESKSNG